MPMQRQGNIKFLLRVAVQLKVVDLMSPPIVRAYPQHAATRDPSHRFRRPGPRRRRSRRHHPTLPASNLPTLRRRPSREMPQSTEQERQGARSLQEIEAPRPRKRTRQLTPDGLANFRKKRKEGACAKCRRLKQRVSHESPWFISRAAADGRFQCEHPPSRTTSPETEPEEALLTPHSTPQSSQEIPEVTQLLPVSPAVETFEADSSGRAWMNPWSPAPAYDTDFPEILDWTVPYGSYVGQPLDTFHIPSSATDPKDFSPYDGPSAFGGAS